MTPSQSLAAIAAQLPGDTAFVLAPVIRRVLSLEVECRRYEWLLAAMRRTEIERAAAEIEALNEGRLAGWLVEIADYQRVPLRGRVS